MMVTIWSTVDNLEAEEAANKVSALMSEISRITEIKPDLLTH